MMRRLHGNLGIAPVDWLEVSIAGQKPDFPVGGSAAARIIIDGLKTAAAR